MKEPVGPATISPTSSRGRQQNEHQASSAGSARVGPRSNIEGSQGSEGATGS